MMATPTSINHYAQHVSAGRINRRLAQADNGRFKVPCYAHVVSEFGTIQIIATASDRSICEVTDATGFIELLDAILPD